MLTIAICTHNRSAQLDVLLRCLADWPAQSMAGIEVLVIANACSDDTLDVVNSYDVILPLKVCVEPSMGLSHARNRALVEFSGSAIWFVDDDTIISEVTLAVYQAALHKYPQVSYFGGPIRVEWQARKPTWLKDERLPILMGLFGIYDLGSVDTPYTTGTLGPYGANFVLRREILALVGDFNTALGVRGEHIGRGEESEYFARAEALGAQGMYLADALVGHRFQLDRISLPYLWRYGLEKGRAEVLLRGLGHDGWVTVAAHQFLLGVVQLCKRRRDRFYQCWINMAIARGRHLASRATGANNN